MTCDGVTWDMLYLAARERDVVRDIAQGPGVTQDRAKNNKVDYLKWLSGRFLPEKRRNEK